MPRDPERKRILAVSSIGGHWIQLLRVARPLEEDCDVVYACTHPKCASMVEGRPFFVVPDFSRWDLWKAVPAFFVVFARLLRLRPRAVVTTGAAPGLLTLAAARLLGAKTIWIDSVANVETLSGCGRIARRLAHRVYAQWPDLADGRVEYAGNVFGDEA